MIGIIRKLAWKILGTSYYNYLKYKNQTNLKDAKWVVLGNHTYDNGAVVWKWYKSSKLEIGKYCSIASHVNFICDSGYHNESEVTTFPLFHEILDKNDSVIVNGNFYKVSEITKKVVPLKKDISIGNDVWIGHGATILPGVSIGNGVTVLAGAIVSENVPDYAVVGGVPSKIVKMKHDDETIRKMNAIAWWDWTDKEVKEKVNDFYLTIEEFIKKYS